MIKAIVITLISTIAGVCLAFAWIAVSALFAAFILGITLDPFLALIDVPFLSERFSGLDFGRLFILVFTLRVITGMFTSAKPDTKNGENK